MPNFRFANRLLTGSDAVEEITHVVVACVESPGIGGQGSDQQFWIADLDVSAGDPDPAVGACELHPVSLTFRAGDAA